MDLKVHYESSLMELFIFYQSVMFTHSFYMMMDFCIGVSNVYKICFPPPPHGRNPDGTILYPNNVHKAFTPPPSPMELFYISH